MAAPSPYFCGGLLVGIFVIGAGYYLLHPRGKLADAASTILDLPGLEKSEEMTGLSLNDTWVEAKQRDSSLLSLFDSG